MEVTVSEPCDAIRVIEIITMTIIAVIFSFSLLSESTEKIV